MKKQYGAIVADIIGSTSLSSADKKKLMTALRKFLDQFSNDLLIARVVKGDQIEMIVRNPKETLRLALMLKCFIKSNTVSSERRPKADSKRLKYFERYGLRMAMAIDKMNVSSLETDDWEGEALYSAGRAIAEEHTFDVQKVVIKSTIQFITKDPSLKEQFDVIVKLIDVLLAAATSRQCEILCHRLANESEQTIARRLGISQPAVNQSLNSIGWRAIQYANQHFSNSIQ